MLLINFHTCSFCESQSFAKITRLNLILVNISRFTVCKIIQTTVGSYDFDS